MPICARASLVKELLNHKSVNEVDETTPSAAHGRLVHAQFENMEEFSEFTNWLKSKNNIDSSRLDVTPIYNHHKRKLRILSTIRLKKES